MEAEQSTINLSKTLKFTKLRIVKNLVIISSSFLLLFTAYNGLTMLQSTMNKEQGIGTMSQAVIYVGFMVASLIIPKYTLKKLGCKMTLTIAISLYVPYLAANFYPVWGTLMPAALLAGIGASILWGSQCTYFNISSILYCTASERIVIEDAKNSSEIPSNCTSIETLSVNDIAYSSEKNVYCISVLPKIDEMGHFNGHNLPPSFISDRASVSTIKNDLEDSATFIYLRRRSSGFEHGFFPPKEFLDGLRSDIQVLENSGAFENGEVDSYSRNDMKRKKSLDKLIRIEIITPLFFGLHGLLYHSSMIWSNMLSYYVLQNDGLLSNITADITANFSCSCGAAFCNGVTSCGDELIAEPTLEMRYLLTGIAVTLGILSGLLVILFLDQLGSDKEPIGFSLDVMMATFNHGKKKEQLFLIPLTIYVGMEQGFYIGDYTKSYIACAMGTYNVGLVTMFYGVTCAFSSTLAGWLVRHVGRIPIFIIGQIINVGTNVYLLLWTPNPNEPQMFFLGALLWGLFTGIFWSQLPAFQGILFKDEEEAAFAFYYLCGAVGYAVSFVCSDQICTNYKIYMMLAVSSTGIIGYLITERMHYLKTRK